MSGQILAMGGGGFMAEPDSLLDSFLLSLSDAARPRICLVPTPSGDGDRGIAAFYEAFAARDCEPSCLRLFGTPERPAEHLASQDVIYVSGGNTANALAIWRLHGIDHALRAAWERGAVLGGVSAGANCWFESMRHRLVRSRTRRRSTTASESCRGASARTTTAKSSVARSTASSSTAASRPGMQPTTARRSTSSEAELREVVSSRPDAQGLSRRGRSGDADPLARLLS